MKKEKEPERLLRIEHIIGNPKKGILPMIPVGRSAWWAGVKEGKYPQPIKIGERVTVWKYSDIQKLIQKLTGA